MEQVVVRENNQTVVFTEEKKQVIKNQFFPKATDTEVEYFLGIAESLGLNPLTKEIQFVPRKVNIAGYNQSAQWVEKYDPIVGRDGRLAIAHKSGLFDGIESSVEMKETFFIQNGQITKGMDLFATAKVYKKGHSKPFVVEVAFNEYVGKNKKGELTSIWATKPQTMIKKVAESQALAKAFNINGVTSEEELDSYVRDTDMATPNVQVQLDPTEQITEQITETIVDIVESEPLKTNKDINAIWKLATEEQRQGITPLLVGRKELSEADIDSLYWQVEKIINEN